MTEKRTAIGDERKRTDLKAAARYSLAVTVFGSIGYSLLMFSSGAGPVASDEFAKKYLVSLIHFIFYSTTFCTAILYARRGGVPKRLYSNWAFKGLSFLTLATVSSTLALSVCMAVGLEKPVVLASRLSESIVTGVVIAAVALLIEGLYNQLVSARLEAKDRELERERARRTAIEAQWSSLESRMRPHFLFNTLSSIRELIHQDPGAAGVMVQRIADLLRFSLQSAKQPLVALEEEMQMVSDYLDIETMRLGARLRVSLDVPDDCAACIVPALSALTLAENSVKHAVAGRRSGGTVGVIARREQDQVKITVSDDGPGFREESIVGGHGLDLLMRRLETLYSGEARLTIDATAEGSSVTVTVPVQVTRQPDSEPPRVTRTVA